MQITTSTLQTVYVTHYKLSKPQIVNSIR